MTLLRGFTVMTLLGFFCAGSALALTQESFDVKNPKVQEMNKKCITCHLKENKSLVLQWEASAHAAAKEGQIGCYNCHAADKGDELGYQHEGAFIKAILSPNDCAKCHEPEAREMAISHHATAGEIMASLDNMLAEVVGGMPKQPRQHGQRLLAVPWVHCGPQTGCRRQAASLQNRCPPDGS